MRAVIKSQEAHVCLFALKPQKCLTSLEHNSISVIHCFFFFSHSQYKNCTISVSTNLLPDIQGPGIGFVVESEFVGF